MKSRSNPQASGGPGGQLHPHGGRSRVERLSTGAAMAAAILLLSGGAWLAGANLAQVRHSDSLSEQVNAARYDEEKLLATLTDAESGQRGYLLTGDPAYLEPYNAALAGLSSEFAQLRMQPHPGAGFESRLGRLHALAMARMARLGRTIALAEAGQGGAAIDRVLTNQGKQIMDEIRVQLAGLEQSGQAALAKSRMSARSSLPRIAMFGMGLLSSLLLAGVALEQRHARRAVTASLVALERFTRAFDLSHGMLCDLDGTITFWARGMEQLYGYSSQEAVGHSSQTLLHTHFPLPLAQILEILRRDGHWEGELGHRHQDGSLIEVASHWALQHGGPKGARGAIIKMNNDISGARRATREADRSSTLLRAIIEAAPALIYAKDLNGRMMLANAGALQLIGKPWAEVEGRTDLDFIANLEQAKILMANDRRIMEAGQAEALEEAIDDPAASERVLLSTKTPFRDSNGQVVGLVGVSVDVTERRRHSAELSALNTELTGAVEALARSEQEFRTSFHFAAVGKLQTDPQGRILRANQAFADMLGYEPHELVGQSFWELIHADDVQDARNAFAPVIEGSESRYVSEKRYVHRDGSAIWGRTSATVARSLAAGAPYMVIAVIENIDERHVAQLALVAAKADLELTVVERTAALRQRDLLLREVYHRVKNNLQIIDSMLIMQSRQLADPHSRAAIDSLRGRVFALGLVHHQLMGSSNLETFDVGPFLEQLVANLAAASVGNGIQFTIRAPPMAVGLDFAIPLGLLVTELVTNSLKHAFPAGAGIIEVSLASRADGTIDLVVSDDGLGYKQAVAAHPAGLGTSIIAGLVTQLDGNLSRSAHNGTRTEIHFAQPGTA